MKGSYFLRVIFSIALIFLALLSSMDVSAQNKNKFNNWNRSYYKSRYGASVSKKPKTKCNELKKKKKNGPKVQRHYAKNTKVKKKEFAESDGSTPVAKVTPKPKPVPKPVPKPEPKPEPKTTDENRVIRDKVLEENNLPAPTNEQHEKIKKDVEKKMEVIEDIKPIKLEPLYFTFDEDEFSVVDMEPFLVAVEYALKGRIILIEGHTDPRGSAQYNVQLSIKRVEKIRSLMHDMGVPDDRISIVGYGEEQSSDIKNMTDEEILQKSRRVDFTVF
ncbi:MAG: OmpA family protein [Cyclobacteriaceae bacterium]|nr:OmpA family protein [Cyclobacteriaceae bacterium]